MSSKAPAPAGSRITICEVGPRDGFQNEKTFIPTAKKIEIANALLASGLRHMQVTSFVSTGSIRIVCISRLSGDPSSSCSTISPLGKVQRTRVIRLFSA